MAIVWAVKSGNWSDPTVWNTGSLPTSADDVYSNTFTVTIDVSPTVLSISNAATTGVTAGGGFVASANGITISANINCSVGATLTTSNATGSVITIIGNLVGGSGGNSHAVLHSSTGTLNIAGNLTGGTGVNTATAALTNNSSGTVNITGNIFGGGGGAGAITAVVNASTGTINVTGAVRGGNNSISVGLANSSTGTVNVTGNIEGTASTGATNSSSGNLFHVGSALAGASAAAIGAGSASQNTILTGPLISSEGSVGTAAASGVNPCVALRWFPADTALSTFEYRMRGVTVSGSPSVRPARQLFLTDAYSAGYPTAANVRSGTAYGPGSIYTGTCAVPPAGSVSLGVPVDNTTGTATFTQNDLANALTTALGTPAAIAGISSALSSASAVTLNQQTSTLTTPGSIGVRLKNVATTQSIGDQIASFGA